MALKSMNFTVLTCTLCGERIKLEPNREVDNTLHECKKVPRTTEKATTAPEPKKEEKTGFFGGKKKETKSK